ncbi:hypothetical protein ASE30_15620 [Achromobacter sp. Root83]|uniref:fimbrial biogenesis chaperone n=1 Tax=Achromobacter sp. Root83 TaxID=1736602 RepID=UPI00070B4600|nr:molecular chaperone [Achromobacter sp. Root83]KRC70960.1 hypothetical protein ASE30_15620 [Achromobacter sp. Root83]
MTLRRTIAALFAATAMLHTHADAAISLNRTRVVFDGKYKEANITVRNSGGNILVQSWVDALDASGANEVPFVVTPPLAKMSANQQQLLRIIHAGGDTMPADRESVFWLNVQEIPEMSDLDNALQISIRQRIKVFFRPSGLTGDPLQAPSALQWKLEKNNGNPALQVRNPGVYHVSISGITLRILGRTEAVKHSSMVAPGQTLYFPVARFDPAEQATLRFESINDYGGKDGYAAQLNASAAVRAQALTREAKSTP